MKAIVIDDFERRGGGQVYGLALADALENIGYETYFLTNIDESMGRKERVAFRVKYEFVEGESKLMNLLKIINLKKQLSKVDLKGFDLSVNNHPNVFIKNGNVNILHGFSFLEPWLDEKGELVNGLPAKMLKFLNIYGTYNGSLLIPNSRYTKGISTKLIDKLGIHAMIGDVLYPPILHNFNSIGEKKGQVLMLGRINEGKAIDSAIEIANDNGFKLIIAGYLNRGDEIFLERMRKMAKRNVEIRTNINEDEKRELLDESSTILSLNRKENFGISVAEGMAHGCVPIVPKSGAPWIDVIEEGRYGLGFSDTDEIGVLINKSFSYGLEGRRSIATSINRFSVQMFREKLKKIVDGITSNRM